jgi:hypothetical protein
LIVLNINIFSLTGGKKEDIIGIVNELWFEMILNID